MPRAPRRATGGMVYHILNRANGRLRIFKDDKDYQAFEALLEEAKERYGMRILAYCVMPNHWHLVLYPRKDNDLAEFMRWLTLTHTQRYHAVHKTIGHGHLYQGRYKSFVVQTDEHFITVVRYVERNALRAQMVARAESWKWNSAWRREKGSVQQKKLIDDWPVARPRNYIALLNEPQTGAEGDAAVRQALLRSAPFGDDEWRLKTAKNFGQESTLRPRGRPRKGT